MPLMSDCLLIRFYSLCFPSSTTPPLPDSISHLPRCLVIAQVSVDLRDFLPSWAALDDKDLEGDKGEEDGFEKLANVLERRMDEKHRRAEGKECKKYLDLLRQVQFVCPIAPHLLIHSLSAGGASHSMRMRWVALLCSISCHMQRHALTKPHV